MLAEERGFPRSFFMKSIVLLIKIVYNSIINLT